MGLPVSKSQNGALFSVLADGDSPFGYLRAVLFDHFEVSLQRRPGQLALLQIRLPDAAQRA